jgi:hypothetical protein
MTGLAEASGDGAAIGDAVQRAERWPAASGICGHGRRIIVMADKGARRGAGRCQLISAGFSWAPDSDRQSRCRSRASRRYSRQGRADSAPAAPSAEVRVRSDEQSLRHLRHQQDPPNGHPLPCPSSAHTDLRALRILLSGSTLAGIIAAFRHPKPEQGGTERGDQSEEQKGRIVPGLYDNHAAE